MQLLLNCSPLLLLLSASFPGTATADSYIHFEHAHAGYEQPVYFPYYEGILGDEHLKRCVRREYPPTNGEECRDTKKSCLWGIQQCNGAIEPATRCNCFHDTWACQAFLCPTIEDEFCPESADTTEVCRNDLFCGYEDTVCDRCSTPDKEVRLPKQQCSCEAGQYLTCATEDACADTSISCAEIEAMRDSVAWFPFPSITERKIDATKTHVELNDNPAACPADEPEYDMVDGTIPASFEAGTCNAGESYECGYGWSCCCPDSSQCSSDLKCQCENGVLTCIPKQCDQFLCMGAPSILSSPFPEDPAHVNPLCPAYSVAEAVIKDEVDGACPTDDDFYHCVYGFDCCCEGRFCSSEMQCTCSMGVLTCDQRTCPSCDADYPEVVCPLELPVDLPNNRTTCANAEGETCGFGTLECCGGDTTEWAQHYCTCENGLWDCFNADFLCAGQCTETE